MADRIIPAGRSRVFALLLLAASLVPAAAAVAQEVVQHRLSFPAINQQYVHVVSRFPAQAGSLELRLANWNPGSYKIRDFAGNLDRIAVYDADGAPLSFRKVRKNAWIVAVKQAGPVVVEYDVYAGELSVRESWVGPEFILINPVTVLLYTSPTRTVGQVVSVDVPAGMGRAYTSLEPMAGGDGWRAADFDELVDSPLVVSRREPQSFREDDHDYHLLDVGDDTFWDAEQALKGLRAVVASANALWDTVPLQRDYWFFNFLVEAGGGLEHDHSTVLMTSRWKTRNREDFIGWLSLAAHEYFHVWNVRRMRPADLAVYDYEGEQYSSALWIAEGLTSYYDNLLLSRAGLVSPEEYLKLLAKDFHRLELTPGRRNLSLRAASRDAWIRQYQPSANSINSNISYYTKGAVIGFALDAKIRQETDQQHSLDDVMRAMFERWSKTPYPHEAFERAVEDIAGRRVRDWLEPLLAQPQDPDLDAALDYYGLTLERHPDRTAAVEAGLNPGAGLGVNWSKETEDLVVGAVPHGTAASRAGLLPGDELLAIDDERVRRATIDDKMSRLVPGEAVDLLLSRRDHLLTVHVELDPARPLRYDILMDEEAGRRQVDRMQNWLGQEIVTD